MNQVDQWQVVRVFRTKGNPRNKTYKKWAGPFTSQWQAYQMRRKLKKQHAESGYDFELYLDVVQVRKVCWECGTSTVIKSVNPFTELCSKCQQIYEREKKLTYAKVAKKHLAK